MILDLLENRKYYDALGLRFQAAFDYLTAVDVKTLVPGKYDIIPGEVYVNIMAYDLEQDFDCRLESHLKYADIQCILAGREIVGYVPIGCASQATQYNAEKDILFYDGTYQTMSLSEGMFVVFFPWDVHKAKMAPPKGGKVIKAVVKVLVE